MCVLRAYGLAHFNTESAQSPGTHLQVLQGLDVEVKRTPGKVDACNRHARTQQLAESVHLTA
jgi:hypothetical protein